MCGFSDLGDPLIATFSIELMYSTTEHTCFLLLSEHLESFSAQSKVSMSNIITLAQNRKIEILHQM